MIPPVNFHVQNMQYAQLVKNLSAMRETWVQSLGLEDPLEKGKATHSSNSGLENSMECIVHGVAKGQTRLSNFHFLDHSTQPRPVRPLKAAPAPRVSPSLPGWHCPALRTPLLPTAKPDTGRAWVIFFSYEFR